MKAVFLAAGLLLPAIAVAVPTYQALPGITNVSSYEVPKRDWCERRDWYKRGVYRINRAHKTRKQSCKKTHTFNWVDGRKICQAKVKDDHKYAQLMLKRQCD